MMLRLALVCLAAVLAAPAVHAQDRAAVYVEPTERLVRALEEGEPMSMEAIARGLAVRAETEETLVLVLYTGRYEEGRLVDGFVSEPFEYIPGDMWLPGDMLIPGDMWLPGDMLIPGDMWLPGDMLIPGDMWLPGDMLIPDEVLEEMKVDWDRQQVLVFVAAPADERLREQTPVQPYLILYTPERE